MKFLFVDTYYPSFIYSFRKRNPFIRNEKYQIQKKALIDACFGTSDFYSYYLIKLGHFADDIIVNDEILQRKWAQEHNLEISRSSFISKIQEAPYAYKFIGRPSWIYEIALAQIKEAKPDIVYIQDLSILSANTLIEAKKYSKLIVGQIASPLPSIQHLKLFDLVITSFPHFVQKLINNGIKSEYLPLAFEPRILTNLNIKNIQRIYDISFVGSFTHYHRSGTNILKEASKYIPINLWSPKHIPQENYHGQAWGLEMYSILAASKIVLNRHIEVAENYANNMRMYEVTGMGSLLITDEKKNIGELFTPDKEIITYKNVFDLIAKVKYYLSHENERMKIAKFGQKRTLKDHNYLKRMKQLLKILYKYL